MNRPSAPMLHVVYYVSDLKRSVAFYERLLMFAVVDDLGPGTAFLRGPGSSEYFDLGLIEVGEEAVLPQGGPRRGTYHVGWLLDDLRQFLVLHDSMSAENRLIGTADHRTHLSLYVVDPDGNEVEVCHRPADRQWPPESLTVLPLDVETLRISISEKRAEARPK